MAGQSTMTTTAIHRSATAQTGTVRSASAAQPSGLRLQDMPRELAYRGNKGNPYFTKTPPCQNRKAIPFMLNPLLES